MDNIEAAPQHILQLLDLVKTIQKQTIIAYKARSLQELISVILKETSTVIKYDRAILFCKKKGNVKILGFSGANDERSPTLTLLVQNLKKDSHPRVLTANEFATHTETFKSLHSSTILWVPIVQGEEEIGLWLERFDDPSAEGDFEAHIPLLKEFLIPAYAVAWEKIHSPPFLRKMLPYVNKASLISLAVLIALFLVPVQLRIVAPAEVVAKGAYVITAPIEGIIQSVEVEPGQKVNKGDLLFRYDETILLSQYMTALKNMELLQTELNRSYVLGVENPSENSKIPLFDSKLEKGRVELGFAKQILNFTNEKAPIAGLVGIDNPNSWRGKPVKLGEKIMTICNPERTKLKIWIPDKDNVTFPKNLTVKVLLNTSPEKIYEAKLSFISNHSKIRDGQLSEFEAEAEWLNMEKSPLLGLKGSAILNGETVPLYYYLLRKPLAIGRRLIGI